MMVYIGDLVSSPRIYFQYVAATFAVQSMGEVSFVFPPSGFD